MKITQLAEMTSLTASQVPVALLLGEQACEALRTLERTLGLRVTKMLSGEAPQELETASLLGPQRLVWVADSTLSASFEQWLVAYCLRPNPQVVLVLTPAKVGAELTGACQSTGLVFDPPRLSPWRDEEERIALLLAAAQEQGVVLQPDAAAILARSSSDRSWLRLELAKLICFVGGKGVIDVTAVRAVSPQDPRETIWDLSRAIFERRTGVALQLLRRIDLPPHTLLAQLRSQIQQGLRICSLLAHEGGAGAVTRAFPYLKGRNLQRRIEQVRGYGEERLRRALVELQRADVALKGEGQLLDTLVARIAA